MGSRIVLLLLSALPLALPLGALSLGGCARTTMKSSAVDGAGGDEMAFWESVARERAVTNHDALYALLATFEVKAGGGDYAARVAAAKKRGWLAESAAPVERETARAGFIAKAVCIETGIKGGATMRVFGPSERYAVQELNHRRWLAGMTAQQSMSGLQLIALLGEAEDHLVGAPETNPEDLPE